jgi:hypothetical protein
MLGALLLIFMVGCTARPSIAELEAEAELTGDTTALEHRRRMDRKMGRVQGEPECDSGHIMACQTKGKQEECGCVSPLDRGLRQ